VDIKKGERVKLNERDKKYQGKNNRKKKNLIKKEG
jgi:hypothetical protein